MGAVQGEGADNTRAAAAETAQKRRKRRGRQKAAPQLKERTRRTGACSSDGGNQTQTACDINLYDKRTNRAVGGEQHLTKDFSTHTLDLNPLVKVMPVCKSYCCTWF